MKYIELRPYYDRPTGQIKNYLSLIEQKIASNFPHWGRGSQGVWPKGDYGKGILRADQFSILDLFMDACEEVLGRYVDAFAEHVRGER